MKKESEKVPSKSILENANKPMDGSRHKGEEMSVGAKDLAKDKGKGMKADLSKSLNKDKVVAKEKRR